MDTIKHDHVAFGKLSLIVEQIGLLQRQAVAIIEESEVHTKLSNISTNITKVPGETYHWYTQNGRDVLSIVGPDEWNAYEIFHGSYVYGHDCTFRALEKIHPS